MIYYRRGFRVDGRKYDLGLGSRVQGVGLGLKGPNAVNDGIGSKLGL